MNVNVLTRLPKIRAVPAPISPLNSTPVYPPHQAQSFVHLGTVGCWGFDVGEGSNGIKDPILRPFSLLSVTILGSCMCLITQQIKEHLAICLHLPKTLFMFSILPDAFYFTCHTSRRVRVREVASDDVINHRLDNIKRMSFAQTWENLKKQF